MRLFNGVEKPYARMGAVIAQEFIYAHTVAVVCGHHDRDSKIVVHKLLQNITRYLIGQVKKLRVQIVRKEDAGG